MFKELIAGIMIVLFIVVGGAFACQLNDGAMVHVYYAQMGQFGSLVPVPGNQEVEPADEQPTAEQLKQFGEFNGGDWTDGVIVFDKKHGVTSLAHKADIVPCEGKDENLE